ncbi:NUDIX domain-containing protein [Candidatus Bipolaricaulota bacterium]|nr:NUDIX domain-containing protein [Candidatus Bipolaricaulota bacterium]
MRWYIESDGRIFLVSRDDVLDLPVPKEVPFAVDRIAPLPTSIETWYCTPHLDRHPDEWTSKDDIAVPQNVAPLVREAVHATMPRVVCEGICIQDKRLLVVKGNRGLTQDRWTLAGGFIQFGEHPADGLRREIREELGVDAEIGECLAVRSKLGETSHLHWILFFYRIELSGQPVANPDEIADARFVEREDGIALLSDSVMAEVIEGLPDFA